MGFLIYFTSLLILSLRIRYRLSRLGKDVMAALFYGRGLFVSVSGGEKEVAFSVYGGI
ncbi:MAG: hypothetical protein PSN37_02510 [Alphaproteobacteria bacterium]|nr:hypothetical protein [Alphaproteobacteria bacterium]